MEIVTVIDVIKMFLIIIATIGVTLAVIQIRTSKKKQNL